MVDADGTIVDEELDETGRKVQIRREQLNEATRELAAALEDNDGELGQRLTAVRDVISHTHATIEDHIREAEASDGLLAQIVTEEPAFGFRAEEMRREHIGLIEESSELVERAKAAETVDELRDEATELIELIQRHRHRSADLLMDTYGLDLSASD